MWNSENLVALLPQDGLKQATKNHLKSLWSNCQFEKGNRFEFNDNTFYFLKLYSIRFCLTTCPNSVNKVAYPLRFCTVTESIGINREYIRAILHKNVCTIKCV